MTFWTYNFCRSLSDIVVYIVICLRKYFNFSLVMNDQKYRDLKLFLNTGRFPGGYSGQKLWDFKRRHAREYTYRARNLWKNGLKVLPKGRAKFIVSDLHRIFGLPKAVVLQQLMSEQYSVVGLEALCRKVAEDCPSCKDNLSFSGNMRHQSLDRRSELCSLFQLELLSVPLPLSELVFHSFLSPLDQSNLLPSWTQVTTSLSLWRPRLIPPTVFAPPFVWYSPAGMISPISWRSFW